MKVEIGFSLVVMLILLVSMGMVVAGENMTDNYDNQLTADNLQDSNVETDVEDSFDYGEDIRNFTPQKSVDKVEFAVEIKSDKEYIQIDDEVKWTITVKAIGGRAKDAFVIAIIPYELKYLKYSSNSGSYNPTTGIWNVGDLAENNAKTLIIITTAKSYGGGLFYVFAESQSSDKEYVMGFSIANFQVSPPPAHPVSRPEDRENRHQSHYLSSYQSDIRSVTKAVSNSTVEAKIDMQPTANPAGLIVLSLMALIGVRLKKYKF